MHVLIGDPRSGGKAYADFEQSFACTVGICRCIAVYGLFVHRLPKRTRFYSGCIESHAKCFYIVIGLAIGGSAYACMCDTRGSSDSTCYDLFVCILLIADS